MKRFFLTLNLILLTLVLHSCKEETTLKPKQITQNQALNEKLALSAMQEHLDAVSNRDLKTLEGTLSPEGNMQLILPGTEIIEKTEGFMDYHREWFETDDWTITFRILNSEVGEEIAMVVVESIYKEPERDGKPYFNRMSISYDLKKINGKWYVIKDHMASIQKSTDLK